MIPTSTTASYVTRFAWSCLPGSSRREFSESTLVISFTLLRQFDRKMISNQLSRLHEKTGCLRKTSPSATRERKWKSRKYYINMIYPNGTWQLTCIFNVTGILFVTLVFECGFRTWFRRFTLCILRLPDYWRPNYWRHSPCTGGKGKNYIGCAL